MKISEKQEGKLITILGATATGKTALAVAVASRENAEIISADSRQVYRGMDIGTGKDLEEYKSGEKQIHVHLVDIADPGEEYNVYRFRKDFSEAYIDISSRGKTAILCGGSGMYLSSVVEDYQMYQAYNDKNYQADLEKKSSEELVNILQSLKTPHNTTDLIDRSRLIRAIMVWKARKVIIPLPSFVKKSTYGIKYERPELRKRITQRLDYRLKNGMIEEVKKLLASGVTPEQLKFYGLEYRYITQHLERELTYHEMFLKLEIAIHQFAKRQMTWFRRMERNNVNIIWIDGNLSFEEKASMVI